MCEAGIPCCSNCCPSLAPADTAWAAPALPLQMHVLEMLVRGIRSLKDAFPESCLAWLPERLQRKFKAQAQAIGTQGTQASKAAQLKS